MKRILMAVVCASSMVVFAADHAKTTEVKPAEAAKTEVKVAEGEAGGTEAKAETKTATKKGKKTASVKVDAGTP